MPPTFLVRRAYDRGYPVGAANHFTTAQGSIVVAEARDDHLKRLVRTATFTPGEGGESVPALRDAHLLSWNGTTGSLTGFEEVVDDKLGRPQRVQQTWLFEPEALADLGRVERMLARAIGHLRRLGVVVEMLPDGGMLIASECYPDGSQICK